MNGEYSSVSFFFSYSSASVGTQDVAEVLYDLRCLVSNFPF